MIKHNLIQGTPQWHEHRATLRNASDTPVVLGCSPYKPRDQLIKERATGIAPEVDVGTQRLFDAGHEAEALARPKAEALIGDDLYPVVGSEGSWSASFDGLVMDGSVAWENKLVNQSLREAMQGGCTGADLPLHYRAQMEHQLMVSGAGRVLFTAANGDEFFHCWYAPDPALRERIILAWDQFDADVAAYTHTEARVKVVAEPVESLPAVSVRVDGKLTIASNVDLFTTKLKAYIERLPKRPETDQEFANAEDAVKALQRAQDACDREAEAMLAPFTDAESARRALADAAELCRTTRLALEKLVKQRKEDIKTEIVAEAREKLASHIAELNAALGDALMPPIAADFAGAIKGKRTVESLRSAANDELARAKIEAKAVAETISGNLRLVAARKADHLVPDLKAICTKAGDDFAALLDQRFAAESQRLEQERQRIRDEEAARAVAAAAAIERARSAEPPAVQAPQATRPDIERHRAAIVEHQDEISRFLATVNATPKEKNTIRAYLVQFVAFQAREAQAA